VQGGIERLKNRSSYVRWAYCTMSLNPGLVPGRLGSPEFLTTSGHSANKPLKNRAVPGLNVYSPDACFLDCVIAVSQLLAIDKRPMKKGNSRKD
jgi:hypothetical protein